MYPECIPGRCQNKWWKIMFEFHYRHKWIPSHPAAATSGVHQQICQWDRPPAEQVNFRMTIIFHKYSTNIPKDSTPSPATCVKNHESPSNAFNNIHQQICQWDTPTAKQVVCIMILSTNDNKDNNNKQVCEWNRPIAEQVKLSIRPAMWLGFKTSHQHHIRPVIS